MIGRDADRNQERRADGRLEIETLGIGAEVTPMHSQVSLARREQTNEGKATVGVETWK